MDKQPTFGQIATLLSILVIPLILWGVNVERRFETVSENSANINYIKGEYKEIIKETRANQIIILDKLHYVELQLKDKANRD